MATSTESQRKWVIRSCCLDYRRYVKWSQKAHISYLVPLSDYYASLAPKINVPVSAVQDLYDELFP